MITKLLRFIIHSDGFACEQPKLTNAFIDIVTSVTWCNILISTKNILIMSHVMKGCWAYHAYLRNPVFRNLYTNYKWISKQKDFWKKKEIFATKVRWVYQEQI